MSAFETASLLAEKGLDSVEDVALHVKRLAKKRLAKKQGQRLGVATPEASPGGSISSSSSSGSGGGALGAWRDATDPRPRVLVLGSGWAAHALIKVGGRGG